MITMEMQELEIVIGRDGQVAVSVKGASGTKCLDLTRALEEQLGDLVERTHTPEFYCSSEGAMVPDCLPEKAAMRKS
ncbi:MAG TPA: DUF2997 domain-containing protein [Methanolinea sp.]|nr:DUF2997 domain-containing protein [Methanolinea sp.]HQK56243.1 DUF2997 domain-containing protein [Methanolinea sp.]